jgi:hypothetical protein
VIPDIRVRDAGLESRYPSGIDLEKARTKLEEARTNLKKPQGRTGEAQEPQKLEGFEGTTEKQLR